MSDERGYHDCSFATLEKELDTNRTTGVTAQQAAEKLKRDGLNQV